MAGESKAGHTPGPWRRGSAREDSVFIWDDDEATYIGQCENDDVSRDEMVANATLMAAAPVLLAACRAAIDGCETCHTFGRGWPKRCARCTTLAAAVAKATGETH